MITHSAAASVSFATGAVVLVATVITVAATIISRCIFLLLL